MNELREYLHSFNILTDQEIADFLVLCKPKTIAKDDYFIEQGKICKEVVFVNSGLFRSFYYSTLDEEVTYCFRFQNSFVSAFSSLISQTPTAENIQALTDAEVLSISKESLDKLVSSSVNWLKFHTYITEQEYINLEKRVFLLQKENAEKRYEDLLENNPDYLNEIPLNYLASYLGISQRHLSRIRGSVTI